MRPVVPFHRLLVAILLLMGLPGCAVTYVDNKGFEHSIGLFHQKVKVEGQLLYVEKSSVGLNLGLSKTDAGLNLGYKNSFRVFVPQDMAVKLDYSPGNVEVDATQY